MEKLLLRKLIYKICRRYSKDVATDKWKAVVGLEIHAQIASKSKLFSRAPNEFASPVNRNVSLFDCSIPGTLPVLNKKCVEAAVSTALSLNCTINSVSTFDRKHYFYADMPSGYQITQQRSPLASNGLLKFQVYIQGKRKPYMAEAKIKQIQLEQDSGKSLHDNDRSLVDLNRAGTPLMELVFEPDLTNGEEAAALVKELCIILQRLGACNCKMEEGALRVDANVSVNKPGQPYGTRTETKNIGSIRGVAAAIQYEINRQINILEKGGTITNETRAWDANTKTTVAMRDKEVVQDYRYMPEPNLPPLHVAVGPIKQGVVNVEHLKRTLPEMPEETRRKLINDQGLTLEQAIILVNENKLYEIFTNIMQRPISSTKLVANFLINDLLTELNKKKLELDETNIDSNLIGEIIELIENQTINRNVARLLLAETVSGNSKSPKDIVVERQLSQINDLEEIRQICKDVLEENDKLVKLFKSGKTKVFKAMLGAVYYKTNQRVNMSIVNDVLKELLK